MKTAPEMKTNHGIVSRSEWLAARKELLAEEKRLTGQMDAVSAKRRALPWVKIEKDYQFGSTEAPGISLFQKTADGTVYHTYSVYGRGVELMMGTYPS